MKPTQNGGIPSPNSGTTRIAWSVGRPGACGREQSQRHREDDPEQRPQPEHRAASPAVRCAISEATGVW